VIDVEGDSEIDEEGAWLFLDFELDRMLTEHRANDGYWTAGYETYLSFGLVQPAKGQSARVDEILRRSQWRQRHGLHGRAGPRVTFALACRCGIRARASCSRSSTRLLPEGANRPRAPAAPPFVGLLQGPPSRGGRVAQRPEADLQGG
jgi:hypothetical protein